MEELDLQGKARAEVKNSIEAAARYRAKGMEDFALAHDKLVEELTELAGREWVADLQQKSPRERYKQSEFY